MATESPQTRVTSLNAAADLSTTGQFRFVDVTADRAVNLTGAAGKAVGVLQNKPKSGEPATIYGVGSTSKVTASAAIVAGAIVGSAASGKARTAVTSDVRLGVALEAAAADNDEISVLLLPLGIQP